MWTGVLHTYFEDTAISIDIATLNESKVSEAMMVYRCIHAVSHLHRKNVCSSTVQWKAHTEIPHKTPTYW